MLDINFIRQNKEQVEDSAKAKNIEVDVDKLLELDDKRRQLISDIEEQRAKQNELSAQIPKADESKKKDLLASAAEIKKKIEDLSDKLVPLQEQYDQLILEVPNIYIDTPVGKTEEENKVVHEVGDKPNFDFKPKSHWEIAQNKGWIDKETAAKVSGARFTYLKGDLVKLQMAIMQFTIDTLTDEGVIKKIIEDNKLKLDPKPFLPVLPPYMLKTDVFRAMDRLDPEEDRYKIDGDDLWLQGSAEHVLGPVHMDEIIEEKDLPIRYLGYATSFRREAGSYGADMEGIFRLHQFDKLEMEVISTPETGMDEHKLAIAIQEYLMQQLEIPYHLLHKCTADIGKPNARGVDIEAWIPSQEKYRETHTADYMTDYQTRRLKTRIKKDGETVFAYTNDATAFALGRTMIAIIENNQDKEGNVSVPKVLQKYMNKESI